MKIALDHTPAHQLALTAEVGEYDASPTVPALTIDHVPRRLHPDRVALAPGVVVRLRAGERTTWVVTEALRKVYVAG